MKKNKRYILLLCAMGLAFVLGVTGILSLTDKTSADPQTLEEDRFIGLFLTPERVELPNGRLYAAVKEDPENGTKYVFENVAGYACFCPVFAFAKGSFLGLNPEEALTDAEMSLRDAEGEKRTKIEASVYVSSPAAPPAFYNNPVYQTASGEVYLLKGAGMSLPQGADDAAAAFTRSEEQIVSEDGKETVIGTDAEIRFCTMDTPEQIVILQFDAANQMIASQSCAPGSLPQEMVMEKTAAYVLVETQMTSLAGEKTTARELFGREDAQLFAFSCRKDGICVKQYCDLIWK